MPAKKKQTKSAKAPKSAPRKAARKPSPSKPTGKVLRDDHSDPAASLSPIVDSRFPIVGIGASAGGLDALERFFKHMPATAGIAVVIVVHLDPSHASILAELIQRHTTMAVRQIKDGMPVKPNSVYIIPPKTDLALFNGKLRLMEPTASAGLRLPIDYFFRSLAQDQRDHGIGIVLSGMGTDGTMGLKAIKGELGIAMAQEPGSAQCDGMPVSAISAGVVDYVLPPEKMPARLLEYVKRSGRAPLREEPPAQNELERIFLLLRSHTGHDFADYKPTTIWRRVRRRMSIHQMDDVSRYARLLQDTPEERTKLFEELLIGVTSFFRDPEAFDFLKRKGLPPLLANKPKDYCLRVWVPACSTGEEAYSIAAILHELIGESKRQCQVQIFATDIDTRAIDVARVGLYPASLVADVDPDRLRRFFVGGSDGYRIRRDIRESVVFAPQDVLRDPPFTRLDLISCRNFLIYLNANLQKRLLPLFHYALRPGGLLFLGSSETVGAYSDLFDLIEKKSKVYLRKETPMAPGALDFHIGRRAEKEESTILKTPETDFQQLVTAFLLRSYTPSAVIVNSKGDIFHIHGRTGKYLEPSPGKARMNILEMAREGLRAVLASALRRAASRRQRVTEVGVRVLANGGTQEIDMSVVPLPGETELLAVIFQEAAPAKKQTQTQSKTTVGKRPAGRLADLERELANTRDSLQSTIEELETSNEELRSANEELQSTNEELQSTNEELETSKEEQQSLHEEVTTVNAELQGKLDQLAGANNDLRNLLDSVGMPIIFLDSQLRVRNITGDSTAITPAVRADVGRVITDFASKLRYDRLAEDAQSVLRDLVRIEREVETTDGHWYSMRVMPYRTVDNVIDGVVITFLDIHEARQAREEVRRLNDELLTARDYAERIVDTVRDPLLVLDEDLRVISANHSFYTVFRLDSAIAVGSALFELGNGQWNVPSLRKLLESILWQGKTFEKYELEHEFPEIGHRKLILNARQMVRRGDRSKLILLAIQETPDDESKKTDRGRR